MIWAELSAAFGFVRFFVIVYYAVILVSVIYPSTFMFIF